MSCLTEAQRRLTFQRQQPRSALKPHPVTHAGSDSGQVMASPWLPQPPLSTAVSVLTSWLQGGLKLMAVRPARPADVSHCSQTPWEANTKHPKILKLGACEWVPAQSLLCAEGPTPSAGGGDRHGDQAACPFVCLAPWVFGKGGVPLCSKMLGPLHSNLRASEAAWLGWWGPAQGWQGRQHRTHLLWELVFQ